MKKEAKLKNGMNKHRREFSEESLIMMSCANGRLCN